MLSDLPCCRGTLRRRSDALPDHTAGHKRSAGDHCDDRVGDHGHDEASLTTRPCRDELIETDVSHRAEHSGDIPMRQASMNGHRAAITDERLSCGQPIPDDGEQIVRQVRDIGHGLMLDLAILAKRPAEVRRNVDLAFVCLFDFRHMHAAFVWIAHGGFVAAGKTKSRKILIFSGYTCNLIVAVL